MTWHQLAAGPHNERFWAARSESFDLTVPRRIAPGDRDATTAMVAAVCFHFFGDPHRRLTQEECPAFFADPANFLQDDEG